MRFYPFEVNVPHLAYSLLGGFIVLFGMFSLLLRERLYIGEACWAFVFGIIIGPNCAGIFDPHSWAGGDEDVVNTVTLEFTRVVLAVGVFAIGVELPKAYMKRHWKSLFFLLAPVMTWGWFVSAGLIYALIPGLNFLSSLAIAACLTPTDPILAAAVVGGKYADKHVPAHIRHLLAAESGCNDGAAFPFLYIALYLIIDNHNVGEAIKDWFLILWLYQVILGVVIGASLGIGFRYLMKFCERHNLIDRHSYVAQYISLALFATGVTALLGSDDLLSSFACGTAFAWDGFFNRQTEESNFSSVIDLLFNIAAFVYVGAWMPFDKFSDAELTLTVWRLIVLAICILILRRLPVVLALYKWIPDIKTFREAIFSGHFGPIGIGGVFISTLAAEVLHKNVEHPDEQTHLLEESIQPIVAFMVLTSILIHGLSIPSFSLGRRVHSVSRTWSRHTGAPDWTNQARMVDRGDDIIINRDDDSAEKGELTPEDGTEVASTPSGSKTPIVRDHADAEKDRPISDASTAQAVEHERVLENDTITHARTTPPLDMPEGEEPVDGTDIISEWQEGPHRVVERRAGPGEEVEVEVIRNFGTDEEKSDTIRGSHPAVHEHAKTYVEKLKLVPHIIEEDVSRFEKELEKDIAELRDKVKRAASPHSSIAVVEDEDDEEGNWASEPEASTSADASRKSRSKSPKVKAASPKLGGAKGRRRNSNSVKKGSWDNHECHQGSREEEG
ncbi:Sodium/hydrogen exchanger family-domain-containing protein [Mucidula mucida]|nr:Sodium/hydrogen exchanger family-domain-containing protein [Mucidula mucida]